MLGNRIDVDAQRDVNRSASREFRVAYHFLLLFSFRSSPTSFLVFLLLTGCLLGPAASNNVDRQCRRQSAQSMSACHRQLVSFSFRFSFFLHLCSCSYSVRFLSLSLFCWYLHFCYFQCRLYRSEEEDLGCIMFFFLILTGVICFLLGLAVTLAIGQRNIFYWLMPLDEDKLLPTVDPANSTPLVETDQPISIGLPEVRTRDCLL